ncbi:MAG: DUF1993 domain-containing protein [Gammaproteobacteria bacterium]|nr:DUF1993 domain-containing protein [Gammaproteobacteria bacterium]
MTISMYQASAPVLVQSLTALENILAKATAHAEKHDIDPVVLLESRLYPDMFPLTRQVQIATDIAVRGVCRLAGDEPVSMPDTEKSFAQLSQRIAKAVAAIEAYQPQQIDGSEDRSIQLQLRSGEMNFTGQQFLLSFVLPNLYFHITTTYAILRHNGVSLGKADFLGAK